MAASTVALAAACHAADACASRRHETGQVPEDALLLTLAHSHQVVSILSCSVLPGFDSHDNSYKVNMNWKCPTAVTSIISLPQRAAACVPLCGRVLVAGTPVPPCAVPIHQVL
jgi:hypothetical protein